MGVAPFNTSIRSNWIVHFKFIACIKLLNISRINLKIRCSYENLNHFSRERISNWLDIPASRSCQFLVSKFQKRVGRCAFGFYCLEKKQSNAPESKHQNSSSEACVGLWPMKHSSNSLHLHSLTVAGLY